MIAPSVIDSIRELLAEGRLSQRKIAKSLGVSRGVVASVADGRRPDYEALRRRREENRQPLPLGPVVRCPTCGGRVHWPCRLCALRERLAGAPPRDVDRRPTEPLGLELRGEARARYEAIHLRRMRQGELDNEGDAVAADPPNDWPEDEEPWS